MRILVDADACPGRYIIEKAAIKNNLELIFYCDINHFINSDYGEVRYVDQWFQSVDIVLTNECRENDLIVTQDYGVAAMVLGKGAYAISPRGYIYNNENIDRLLFERHISSRIRRSGGKTSTFKKRTIEDDKRLYDNLIKLIHIIKY